MDEFECDGCKKETEKCECNAILSTFDDVNKKLLELDLLERLTSQVVTSIVRSRIEKHVQETCKGSFTISHIQVKTLSPPDPTFCKCSASQFVNRQIYCCLELSIGGFQAPRIMKCSVGLNCRIKI